MRRNRRLSARSARGVPDQVVNPGPVEATKKAVSNQYTATTGFHGRAAAANTIAARVNVLRVRWLIVVVPSALSRRLWPSSPARRERPPLSTSIKTRQALQACARR